MTTDTEIRRDVLSRLGAADGVAEELLAYGESRFRVPDGPVDWPLPDEPFAPVWDGYAAEVERAGTVLVLARNLVQLRFPVRGGISLHPEYRACTRRGSDPGQSALASGLQLKAPELCRIRLHQTAAGRIPILIAPQRQDFVSLVRALANRNEPVVVPDSQGAVVISGYNNWDRVRRLAGEPTAAGLDARTFEFLAPQLGANQPLYQDRFILIGSGPYSGVPASALGLTEADWGRLSIEIRCEHECTHYVTRRCFGSMRNNALDELVADYRGVVAATGGIRPEWLLHFFGLESFPHYRRGGRLENYRADPSLSDTAFVVLQRLVHRAIWSLAAFDGALPEVARTPPGTWAVLLAVAGLTLEELACEDAPVRLRRNWERALTCVCIRDAAEKRDPDTRILELEMQK
jgi:hypothetical protein